MNIHEYQAREILESYGVNTLPGNIAKTPEEAEVIAQELNCPTYVIKAQIHAGGAERVAGSNSQIHPPKLNNMLMPILGMQLVTPQTGPEGKLVRKVLIAEAAEIEKEFYLAYCSIGRHHDSP